MENGIEEDIERLKLCFTNQCNICGRYEKEECRILETVCKALDLVEKLQKENEELKEENEYNKILLDINNNFTIDKKTGNYKWNVIEIQKVKDKIEELNSRIEIYTKYVEQGVETDVEWVDNVADRETVKVLQELIEEREEE